MFGIGMPEMLLILAVALIVIGPKKLPDLAKSLGRALGEFKKATSDLKESMEIESDLRDVKTAFNDMNTPVVEPIETTPPEAAAKPADTPPAENETDTTPEVPATSTEQTTGSDKHHG